MTAFLQEIRREFNQARTENGAVTNASSFDAVVDFFGAAGAMRYRPDEAADLFEKAYREDPQSAIRTMFYLRDVRGGQGERAVFRACLKRLADLGFTPMDKVLKHIPEYGRWDDIFYEGSKVTGAMAKLVGDQLVKDAHDFNRGESVSLLAKWLPSDTSKGRAELAINLRKAIGLDQRKYRKVLSRLRSRIELLEHDMSAKRWDEIDWGKLPSQAHRTHVKAFHRHTPAEYQAYLDSVTKGEAKINTSTLYPHEVYRMATRGEPAADVMWANLPDYTTGSDSLVMADVSGSMTWENNALAMAVSVSLALYFAERNKGAYNGYFMTFASSPQLIKAEGETLRQRLASIENAPLGGSTNLEAAFDTILAAGVRSGEVPKSLYIVSDMEFNQAVSYGSRSTSIFEGAKGKFVRAGLELPHVVFWNVNARNSNYPALAHDGNVSLVSGFSPSIFGMAVEGKSPAELVQDVVNGPRYQPIVI
ncbi:MULTISPECIES: DUF2828 family protein [Mycobacteroides]|uniref:DUF2828 family protein n=1 Tax=Mycobacteroides TaxID=670516 RepID=UPI000927CB95|nr:DUF2828 family protein [Mycobacteroides abscessus]NGX06413.1 hypothetical protein [Mycobacteroides franklinii]SHT24450.1 Domain of uncharacterised function (DUF2828) [Mycobacteroides abscessus subsp. abscessus]SHW68390.1 Domain of uncharacterised function (DUF2828) [Mycobacteroides abscessus subsp. abscessus]SHY69954.1 Domain of uncharacterised function (DUF2828) [Mycobacteroides abscessus subsp. abscessus]SHZ45315.1 Domain of uncharacterised function (DUF2828) [Mycobacteroides abscessus su